MKKLIFILFALLVCMGCEKLFLGEDEPNNPVNNFELFWQDFDEHYSLFHARGFNWDSIYQVYRPQVNDQTNDEELWNIFKEMIAYLDDGHTSIADPEPEFRIFFSGNIQPTIEEELSTDLIKDKYIENFQDIPTVIEGGVFDNPIQALFGKVQNKDIGYIYLNAIVANDLDFMDNVLSNIGHHKAIILDLRSNNGGDDMVSRVIAGRFADNEDLSYTIQERNGPNHTDFAEKKYYHSQMKGSEHFSKPLIVLTDGKTISAAETLLIHLKSFEQVTQIGDTTAGDLGSTGMRRFLPNGWQFRYSVYMLLLPDGSSLDGIGHIPDVQIRNSVANIESDEDLVFEKAVQYLFDEYGIE